MIGPGNYDQEATELMEKLNAKGIILVVFNDDPGASILVPEHLADLAADMMECTGKAMKKDNEIRRKKGCN